MTFIFYPDVRGFVFAFTWGRILIQSSHPVLQVGLRLGWSHHQQLLLPASASASTSEWEGCSWQWCWMPQSSISLWQPRNIHSCPDGLRPWKAVPVLQRLYPESFPSSVQYDAGGGILWYDDVGPKFFLILEDKQELCVNGGAPRPFISLGWNQRFCWHQSIAIVSYAVGVATFLLAQFIFPVCR